VQLVEAGMGGGILGVGGSGPCRACESGGVIAGSGASALRGAVQPLVSNRVHYAVNHISQI
jgi:hypothetical protein